MALALVQSKVGTGVASLTLTSSTTAGNCVVVVTDNSVSSITLGGSAGNFSKLAGNSTNGSIAIWADPSCAGSQTALASTGGSIFYAYEVSGVASASVLDKSSTNNGTSSSPWTSNATATTTQAAEFWIGAVNHGNGGSGTVTLTGPSAPWTNLAAIGNGTTVAQLSGWQITSSTGAATYSGNSAGTGTGWGAVVVTLLPVLATTSTGSMSMSSIGMSATALGGNTTTTGSMSLAKMSMAATNIETFAATGSAALNLAMSGTVIQGFPFPQALQDLKVELLLNGTWTDITDFVYERADIVITAGRSNETQNATPGSMTLTLNNRDGRFSTQNSSGAYYPFVQQNAQIRVSAQTDSIDHGLDYRFWGQVSEWPPQWDTSDSDIYVGITANGWLTQLNQNPGNIGSSIKRYVQSLSGDSAPVGYWPGEDPSGSTSFASGLSGGSAMTWTGTPTLSSDTSFGGSDALPQLNGSVWTGAPGSFATPQSLFTIPGTYSWICPQNITTGNTVVTAAGAAGGTDDAGSAFGSSAAGAGGAGEEAAEPANALTPGSTYTVVVGAPGTAGGNNSIGGDGGNSSFSGPGATTVLAHGGKGGHPAGNGGNGGSGSTNTAHHNGGAGGAGSPGGSGGGGGGSGGTGSAGNSGSGTTPGSAVTGGGPGGITGTAPASGPGGGGGGGPAGNGIGTPGGNGYAGQVSITVSGATPTANVLRFLLKLPAGGGVNGAILGRLTTGGTIARIDVIYGTGGKLQLIGYNAGGSALFTSTAAGSYNGVNIVVSAELTQSGTSVAWALKTITPGLAQTATTVASGTLATTSLASAATVLVNVSGTDTGTTVVGHAMVQYTVTSLPDLAAAASGHNGEYAADRFTRLCAEEGIASTLVGTNTDTPLMGPQADDTLINILQGIENLDRGLLYETRTQFGLSYRTRKSMQNQVAVVSFDYSAHEIVQPLQPVDDEQQTRNDVTVTRSVGSSARWFLSTGPKSILSPPSGVGAYPYPLTVTANADSQLANLAQWIGTTGTVNEYRYPTVTADLARSAIAAKFSKVTALTIGDYFSIANTPSFVSGGTAKGLAFGYTETLNGYVRTFVINSVPESPYEGGGLPTW